MEVSKIGTSCKRGNGDLRMTDEMRSRFRIPELQFAPLSVASPEMRKYTIALDQL